MTLTEILSNLPHGFRVTIDKGTDCVRITARHNSKRDEGYIPVEMIMDSNVDLAAAMITKMVREMGAAE